MAFIIWSICTSCIATQLDWNRVQFNIKDSEFYDVEFCEHYLSKKSFSLCVGLFNGRPADHLFMLIFNSIISIVSLSSCLQVFRKLLWLACCGSEKCKVFNLNFILCKHEYVVHTVEEKANYNTSKIYLGSLVRANQALKDRALAHDSIWQKYLYHLWGTHCFIRG